MNDLIGGRYRIHRRLGAGGMGAVYEATDSVTGHVVAVKVVTAEVARNEVLLGRFEREVRAARGLSTPHVVRFLDAGRDESSGLPFLVMELLDGEDVQRVLRRLGPVRPELALRIVGQACRGLEVAHAQRVVHRDIKPANLFLARGPTGERTLKILDFGIAKLSPDESLSGGAGEATGLTRTGSMLGSPLYMSPEQARGHKNIDARADLWSLGVVLYQALSGRTPHQDSDALGDLIIAICTEAPEPVDSFAPWVPPEVAALVHRALTLDVAGRYQSATEMRAAIEALLPDGLAIREDALVPLPEAERTRVARAISRPGTQMLPRAEPGASRTISDEPTARWSPHALGADTPAAMQLGALPSASPGATTEPHRPAPRARTGLVAAGALGVALAAGAITFALAGRAPQPVASSSAPVVAPSSSAPSPAPAPDRTARVSVAPTDAEVEVDGKRASLAADGTLSITGALGSVHQVRLRAGGDEITREVVIAADGAVPSSIALGPKPDAAVTPSATPAGLPVPSGAARPWPSARTTGSTARPAGNADIYFKR
jgi:serine/threonine-protein kinase